MLEIILIAIIILVLILPITVHQIEKNLEAFLFIMGIAAITFSHFLGDEKLWSMHLFLEALTEPIMISSAVIIVGVIVFVYKKKISDSIILIEKKLGSRLFIFLLIAILGIFSSMITAIMAAILLVEAISVMKHPKDYETKIVIYGCFAIGMGAALTPIGEPLSTILVAKLKGEPYFADFFFPLRIIGLYVIPGILFFAALAGLTKIPVKDMRKDEGLTEIYKEKINHVIERGIRVYVFIMALIFLGTGFKPIINKYIIHLPAAALYWINILSAVLDNATLTAAEISPRMNLMQIEYEIMGLLIAGGMLIPGNIPNIISAGKLNIKSKEWAKTGVPIGFLALIVYFVIFEFIVFK